MDRATSLEKPINLVHLLHHNNSPSQDEERLLIQSLQQLLKTMSSLDTHLADENLHQDQREALWQQRLRLKHLIQTHKGVLSPLRRFPPEILAVIFMMSVGTNSNDSVYSRGPSETDDMFRQFHSCTGPYALLQVCSFWRQVALGTPRLWSGIAISSKSTSQLSGAEIANNLPLPFLNKATALLNQRITWSGLVPLDISFQCTLVPYDPEVDTVKALLNRLLDFTERWRSVQFRIGDHHAILIPCLHRLVGAEFPHLQEANLSLYVGRNLMDFMHDVFSHAPQLSRFRYRPVSHDNIVDFRLPWKQLIACEFDAPVTHLPSLLQRCPNLQQLIVYSKDELPWQNPTLVTQDALESVSLLCRPYFEPSERQTLSVVLEHLQLPGLKELKIEGGTPRSGRFAQTSTLCSSLNTFFTTSQPVKLQVLSLSHFGVDEAFLDLLRTVSRTCPGLAHLQIGISFVECCSLAEDFIALFAVSDLGRALSLDFPSLEKLSLNIGSLESRFQVSAFLATVLLTMVQSRRDSDQRVTGIKALRTFELVIPVFSNSACNQRRFICPLKGLQDAEFEVIVRSV
ncbi:hypothetical protein VKT23_008522 [Stygiomarasmius scandens]|uniref:F-box domain-containing protein n=1 Tax=Marasmiellus scandens TaxID=2682957 RepID=A0ABR1JGN4_9AGAR